MYPAAYINRNPFNAHLREDGGSTYLHYNGKYGRPVFEFGQGLVSGRTKVFFRLWRIPGCTLNMCSLERRYDCLQSYTTFTYTNGTNADTLAAPATMQTTDFEQLHADQPFSTYSILVNNTGDRAGATSVLGFVQSSQPGAPIRKLFAFSKVFLEPGKATEVMLVAPARAIATVGSDGATRVLEGVYTILIGEGLVYTHTVVGDRAVLLEKAPY
jgi:hypothetical protein